MITYIIIGLLIIVISIFLNKQNGNMKITKAKIEKINKENTVIPKYPIYPTEKTELQRRMFDSLTYDYIDDKSKTVNLKLVCF